MTEHYLEENILDAKIVSQLREPAGWHKLSESTLTPALQNSVFFPSLSHDNKVVAMDRIIDAGLGKRITENLVNRVKASGKPGTFFGLMPAFGVSNLYEKFGFKQRPNNISSMSI